MEHSIILAGKNNQVISDIMQNKDFPYKFFSSSLIKEDLENHIKLLKPSAIICCLQNEVFESINTIVEIRDELPQKQISLILIGTTSEIEFCKNRMTLAPDLAFEKPYNYEKIAKEIRSLMSMKNTASIAETQQMAVEADKKHVLVVDDDPFMLKLIKEHLNDKYNVALTNSGITALKFLQTKKTDLIILDYEMPEINGPEVLASIRDNYRTADIPVVFLTGTKEKEKVKSALMLKPQGYLLKPIEKDKLLAMITSLIG